MLKKCLSFADFLYKDNIMDELTWTLNAVWGMIGQTFYILYDSGTVT